MSVRLNLVSQNILFISQLCDVYARFIFMDFELIAFIESIQTWNYVYVYMKVKRITNPKHRYNAHCAPLVYRYFRPTHVIGGEENCFWESKSAHKPVIIMSLWSLNTLLPKPAIGKVLPTAKATIAHFYARSPQFYCITISQLVELVWTSCCPLMYIEKKSLFLYLVMCFIGNKIISQAWIFRWQVIVLENFQIRNNEWNFHLFSYFPK